MKSTKSTTPQYMHCTSDVYSLELVPAMRAYRDELNKACRINTDQYCRMFTEKRTSGIRSKYWFTKRSAADSMLRGAHKFIAKNPLIRTSSGAEFMVSAKLIAAAGYRSNSCYDLALFAKRVA